MVGSAESGPGALTSYLDQLREDFDKRTRALRDAIIKLAERSDEHRDTFTAIDEAIQAIGKMLCEHEERLKALEKQT